MTVPTSNRLQQLQLIFQSYFQPRLERLNELLSKINDMRTNLPRAASHEMSLPSAEEIQEEYERLLAAEERTYK